MRKTGLWWIWVGVIVLIVDRLTKHYVQMYLMPNIPWMIFPGFNLNLTYNTGAAFSFLDQASGWQVDFFGVIAAMVSIILLCWLSRISAQEKKLSLALSFIIGGALGNLWDRLAYGKVVDFLQFYIDQYAWPTFNVADSAVCLGALLMFLHILGSRKEKNN